MFRGLNPPEEDGILRTINIRNTISFGEAVKSFVACRMLKNTTGMKEILRRQNSRPFLEQFLMLRYQVICCLLPQRFGE
jgi:hypothetical protein